MGQLCFMIIGKCHVKRQHMGDESIEHSCTYLLMESKRIAGLLSIG